LLSPQGSRNKENDLFLFFFLLLLRWVVMEKAFSQKCPV
jgi:hypothetical protein